MRAQLEQAEASKEEQLMRRLLRQSQAERRMVVQLLQVRREKRTIRENRAFREAQYAECRAKDFELALDRESVSTSPFYLFLISPIIFIFSKLFVYLFQ